MNETTFQKLITWLKGLFFDSVEKIYFYLKEFFFWAVQQLIDLATLIFNSIASIIPDMSGIGVNSLPDISTEIGIADNYISTGLFGFARWVLPIDIMVTVVTLIVAALVAFYTIGPLLRWIKVIK